VTASKPEKGISRVTPTGVAIRVRLTPRAQRDGIDGLEETAEGTALKARVRAIPESGAANTALERLVSDWLGVPKSTVAVTAGGKSRLKTVAVSGNSEMLQHQLAGRLADLHGPKPSSGS
jgi:uncharacterized protein